MNWIFDENRIYSEDDNGELLAEVSFDYLNDEEINVSRVYVNPILRGKGVANEAMVKFMEHLRIEGKKARATCSYAKAWLEKQ
ncbi:MAG: GNAT family N-acetyltransferase [Clostridium sp.]